MDAIHSSGQHSVSTNASRDQRDLYTHADTGPDFSTSPIALGVPSTYTVRQYEGGTSRNQPIQSPQTTKTRNTALSRSSGRPTGARERREAPKPSYACPICGGEYAQKQGAMRHYRTIHHPSSCSILFCDYKWGRPDHYRDHLTKWHRLEVAVVDKILRKPAGSRRRTTIIGRDLPQNVPLPVIKRNRQAWPNPRKRRLMSPLSLVTKVDQIPSAFSPT